MARRLGIELAEVLDVVDRHALIAREVKQSVDQHRAMASRQHEAVAVRPVRRHRIEFEDSRKENGRHVSCAHWQPGMTGFGRLYGVHCEEPQGIGHAVVLFTRDLYRHVAGRA
jgi:hypothetical protein